jgi:hypothetical protein
MANNPIDDAPLVKPTFRNVQSQGNQLVIGVGQRAAVYLKEDEHG